MTDAIDLTASQLAIVRDILRAYLAPATRARALGSRATAAARRYSDLDLALEGITPLGPTVMAELADALSQSDLPYKADIIDPRSIDSTFGAMIEPDMIPVPL